MMSTYILFYSSNYTAWAENVLKDAGIDCNAVTVPRDISAECGSCLKLSTLDIAEALKLLENKHVPIDRVEKIEK
ncbi:MAG: DUF3343 domain-containing protein [Sulfurovum sp.]|nr:DUF3343 domain-containing protein [Sulfurovum sp.]